MHVTVPLSVRLPARWSTQATTSEELFHLDEDSTAEIHHIVTRFNFALDTFFVEQSNRINVRKRSTNTLYIHLAQSTLVLLRNTNLPMLYYFQTIATDAKAYSLVEVNEQLGIGSLC